VLHALQVTPAQKKAARGILIGAIAAAVAVAAIVLALTLPADKAAAAEMPDELAALGLTGDPTAVETAFLYGASLRAGIEDYGAQSIEARTEDGAPGVYLPGEDVTVERGTLTDASVFAQLVNLKELALSANAFEDLTPLWGLTQLRRLDLSCNLSPVSLEGISALSELEYLNLAYCKISGSLEELDALPKLQTLMISSDYLAQTQALAAKGVRVLCPSVTATDWESLKTCAASEYVYQIILSGDPVTIPAGERLTIRKNVHFTSEQGSVLDNYGTIELRGTWGMGMTQKNNYGSVVVRDGGLYACGMGDSHNYGDFTVDPGGVLEVDLGEQFYLERGTVTVDGTLRIGGGGVVHWNGGAVVNNGVIDFDATEDTLDEMLSGHLADITGSGTLHTAAAAEDAPELAQPADPDQYADLPNDPNDLGSLDEYGMTPRERAYYDTVDYRSPTWGGGSQPTSVAPYVDAETYRTKQQGRNLDCYLARDMVVTEQPLWIDGYSQIIVAPGATVTLQGEWRGELYISVMPGGTLIIDGDVQYYTAYNAGTLIVNGQMTGGPTDEASRWIVLGSSGAITVNGTLEAGQLYRFAGAKETGGLAADEVLDFTDMAAPLCYAHSYQGMMYFAIYCNENDIASMWWLTEQREAAAALPDDPADLDSLDEYGMTPRERAYFDTLDYRYPTWSGVGTEKRNVTPYVDAETLMVKQPAGCEYYLARNMTVAHQPAWFEGFADVFIGPGATVTLCGDDWTTGLALTILPGATLIIEGDVQFEMAYNAGTLIVNGRLYGEAPSSGIRWGMFGNSGSIEVNGSFAPGPFYRFAGGSETGQIDASEIINMSYRTAPVQYANGYHSMALFAQICDEGLEDQKWWTD
jgi:hypothetical protein